MPKRSKKRMRTSGVSTSVGGQRPPSWFQRDWLWGLLLILFVILTYTPVWQSGFIWDDDTILTANPCIVGPLGLKEIWTTRAADICPLVLTTFWVEHALWGLGPLPYHLVNVLMHGACAVVLWRALKGLRVPGAWLSAALWALHPVAVESVAWITEMKNTEPGLFFLLSVLFFVRWLRAKELEGRARSGWNYALSMLFAALAIASKSSTVILPAVLCLCAWWVEGRWYWRNLMRVFPALLMSIAASSLSIWTQGLLLAAVPDPQLVRTWTERLATAGDAVWFYLGKLLWPSPLVTIYPHWEMAAGQRVSYFSLLAVIIVLAIFWLNRAPWSRPLFFAFAYFLAALLPVLGLIDNYVFHYSLVFDHFQYLASIGPLTLAGAGLAQVSDSIIPRKRWLQSSLCIGLLLILGMVSWRRTLVYESQETLWTDTLAENPHCCVGHNDLGLVCLKNEQIDEAVNHFQKAVEINPNYVEAHSNLGLALFKKGQVPEAVAQYQKALEINPNSFVGHANLANAFFKEGQLDEAVAEYQKAAGIDPSYFATHYDLGLAFIRKGQLDEAITQFQETLRLKPDFSPAKANLAQVQALMRQQPAH